MNKKNLALAIAGGIILAIAGCTAAGAGSGGPEYSHTGVIVEVLPDGREIPCIYAGKNSSNGGIAIDCDFGGAQ